MSLPNRDTIIAIVLLFFTGVLIWASFDIRSPDYGILAPSAWPRSVLAILTVFGLIYLFQSLRTPQSQRPAEDTDAGGGLIGWFVRYRNPLWCYLIYFLFLATLPFFGTLIGGILLVFLLLSVLGGFAPKKLLLHGVIASVSMGAMWAIFTFGLRVILPRGSLFEVI
ncbi:tripartite tricarboxylate transporter TctB family protein [Pelagibius sp. Alg239-R121]|uniref:tripartite tricarboxylate transporter TctB family protein n=1 Tax=Pelagibius sp. Alg239-R121 TaxID=2993448 RepID=UPI0024A6552F|nr:tripartite tricarboxylate transporter TctB family protein [Pelagibius sp. Alg239-R121]